MLSWGLPGTVLGGLLGSCLLLAGKLQPRVSPRSPLPLDPIPTLSDSDRDRNGSRAGRGGGFGRGHRHLRASWRPRRCCVLSSDWPGSEGESWSQPEDRNAPAAMRAQLWLTARARAGSRVWRDTRENLIPKAPGSCPPSGFSAKAPVDEEGPRDGARLRLNAAHSWNCWLRSIARAGPPFAISLSRSLLFSQLKMGEGNPRDGLGSE